MLTHFRLILKCGGVFETSAVKSCPSCDRDYQHNYVGKEMPARCCAGDHTVVKQEIVSLLTGETGHLPEPAKEG